MVAGGAALHLCWWGVGFPATLRMRCTARAMRRGDVCAPLRGQPPYLSPIMTVTIHILLATCRGASHLHDQLQSIERQTHTDWHLWASDDDSKDATLSILHGFQRRHASRTTVLRGRGQGACRNFFELLQGVKPGSADDLFAFCDQDDVWFADKLARACCWHAQASPSEKPNLYCARTQVTDSQLHPLYLSRLPRRPLTLRNALVENVASGNTMVMNFALLQTLRRIRPENAVMHDWSAYLAATACGGEIGFDVTPCLLYRQHETNVVGARKSWAQRWQRWLGLLQGNYRNWGDITERALHDLEPLLTPSSRGLAAAFHAARHSPPGAERLRRISRAGLVRQRRSAQMALWAALLWGVV